MNDSHNATKGLAWGLFAISIWVSWMLATRWGVHSSLDFWDLTALRFGSAGLIMLPVALRGGLSPRTLGPGAKGWLLWATMIAGAGFVYQLCAASAFVFAPISHGSVMLPGTMPLFVAGLSVVFLGERIAPARRAGFLLIPVGVLCLAWVGFAHGAGGEWRGQALFVTAALLWASYTIAMRKAGTQPLQATALVCVWSAVFYLPFYALLGGDGLARAGWGEIAFQTLIQGVLSSVVSLIAYNRALQLLGASRGAALASLVPVLATVFAIPLLGEWPAPLDWLGVAIISTGVYLATGAPLPAFLRRAPA
ncbi:MAG: EamA family transporter [Alphaproteobacteria bacterium]|nr:EamA family transporter [Alphaproteobacteria bacterium]